MGIEAEVAAKALADAGRVPGRFEPVEEGQGFGVLVDYAHTPDSLENVLRAARELTKGTLHVVFGAGGDRDKAKRPLMGKAAADHADRLVVTSDNPRSEDPDAIVDQVMEGAGPGAEREVDRRKAIAKAVAAAAGRRRGGHRRQGPRAGPGVRGRPQGAVRRRAGGPRGAEEPLVKDFERAVIDTREVRPGDLFVGLRGERTDGGRFAADALAAGAAGVLVAPEHADGLEGGTVITAERPAGRPAGDGPRLAPRAGREGHRRHRLDRQDVDQGHPDRAAGPPPAHARQPPEPEHRDRAAADHPRGAARHRGAGAGDGHARPGADRRAGGHRRAGRGRDRERRPRAPGAAGHGRAGGGGQGRADPRPGARRGLRGARLRAAAGRPPARRPGDHHLRPRRAGQPAGLRRRPRRDRRGRLHAGARPALLRALQPAEHAGRRGRRAGRGGAPVGPRGARVLVHARRDRGARRAG